MSGSLTGVFTFVKPRKPLHVAACLGLTSWAERLIDRENVNELSGGCNKPPSTPPRPSDALEPEAEAAIDFCTFTSAAITFPGWQPNDSSPKAVSWGCTSDEGGISKSSGARTGPIYSRVYGPGDTVGCGVDFVKNVSWFTRNGERWEYEVGDV